MSVTQIFGVVTATVLVAATWLGAWAMARGGDWAGSFAFGTLGLVAAGTTAAVNLGAG